MKFKVVREAALLCLGTGYSLGAAAHHSAAMFDMQKTVTVQGVVKDFQYTNPHSWLIVLTKGADGNQMEWSFETEGPSTLERAGIKRSSLQAGDKITVTTHPMKDGRPAGVWLTVTKSDGTVLQPRSAFSPDTKTPAAS